MKKSLLSAAILAFGLAGTVSAAPVQWTTANGGNDHWYEVVYNAQIGIIDWATANSEAQSMSHLGETGYLASITSAAEQTFLNGVNHQYVVDSPYYGNNVQYVKAWLGGNDLANEGNWQWTSGEAFAYSNWAGGEPNNYGGEDNMLGWWSGDQWNDCKGTCDSVRKFIVEYNVAPSNVPIPATLPLIVAGLGAMGFFGRRKKA